MDIAKEMTREALPIKCLEAVILGMYPYDGHSQCSSPILVEKRQIYLVVVVLENRFCFTSWGIGTSSLCVKTKLIHSYQKKRLQAEVLVKVTSLIWGNCKPFF